MDGKLKEVEVGFQLCLDESDNSYGAVRQVAPGDRDELIVYIRNEGNFIIPSRAVQSVHNSKVMLDREQVDDRIRHAISRVSK